MILDNLEQATLKDVPTILAAYGALYAQYRQAARLKSALTPEYEQEIQVVDRRLAKLGLIIFDEKPAGMNIPTWVLYPIECEECGKMVTSENARLVFENTYRCTDCDKGK